MQTQSQSKDAIALLVNDHRQVKELVNDLKSTDLVSRAIKKKVAESICDDFTVHNLIEEKIFYPKCREPAKSSKLMNDAILEHAGAKELISQIKTIDSYKRLQGAKIKVLFSQVDKYGFDSGAGVRQKTLKVVNVELLTLGVDVQEWQEQKEDFLN